MSTKPSTSLDTFENPNPDRDYTIRIDMPEFTCLCPLTGQPDFASIEVEYVPDELCLELKSPEIVFLDLSRSGRIPRSRDQQNSGRPGCRYVATIYAGKR